MTVVDLQVQKAVSQEAPLLLVKPPKAGATDTVRDNCSWVGSGKAFREGWPCKVLEVELLTIFFRNKYLLYLMWYSDYFDLFS